ncbi:HMA2 domain-containing protein [Azospirillum halopraeferens]|uniref:HMA2 domain-containing protein n=1 Tax=Azospirillum halopraeferens TaxID=34010 RepID=UPI000419AF0C|nr:hypothetical protein [Azospirillum halopraeferens]
MSERGDPVVSVLPGRIRLRHPGLRRPDRHDALTARLATLEGVRVAEGNPVVGSLLLVYDPAAAEPAAVLAAVRAAADAVLAPAAAQPPPEPTAVPATPAAGRSLKWQVNRMSKVGMLTSLAATLAALGVSKRLHARAGIVFVALSAVHTLIHRRRLLR